MAWADVHDHNALIVDCWNVLVNQPNFIDHLFDDMSRHYQAVVDAGGDYVAQ